MTAWCILLTTATARFHVSPAERGCMSDFSVSPRVPGAALGSLSVKICLIEFGWPAIPLCKMHILGRVYSSGSPSSYSALCSWAPLLQPSLICQVGPPQSTEVLSWANCGGGCPSSYTTALLSFSHIPGYPTPVRTLPVEASTSPSPNSRHSTYLGGPLSKHVWPLPGRLKCLLGESSSLDVYRT